MDGSIANVLSAFNLLLTHLEKEQRRFEKSHDKRLFEGINVAWRKLNKYYTLTNLASMYIVAIVCDPRRNMAWIRWTFRDRRDWIEAVERIIKEFYQRYRNKSSHHINIDDDPAVTFASWSNQDETATRSARTYLDRNFHDYLSLPTIAMNENPLSWWRERENKFSTWFEIAFDVLPIPAMSAEAERVFSRFATLTYIEWADRIVSKTA